MIINFHLMINIFSLVYHNHSIQSITYKMCLFTVYVIGKISGYSSLFVAGELIVTHRFSTVQGVSSKPLIV